MLLKFLTLGVDGAFTIDTKDISASDPQILNELCSKAWSYSRSTKT